MASSKKDNQRHADTGLELVEHTDFDATKKPPGFIEVWKNKRVLLWCLIIYLLPINFGFESASTGNILAIPTFLRQFGTVLPNGGREISAYDQQLLNAAMIVGLFVSSFAVGYISDIIGRKITIIIASLICIAGILVQTFSYDIPMLTGGKVISSFGFGLGQTLGPVYVAEVAPENIRGICLALLNVMTTIGSWACSLIAYGTSHMDNDWAWRTVLLVQLFPPVLMFLFSATILPESPSWLVIKGRSESAANALRKFRGPNTDIDAAIKLMEATIQREKELEQEGEVGYLDCFRGSNLRRTIITCMVFVGQQFSGVYFVAGYLPYFFTLAGVANPIGTAQISNSMQVFGNICSWFLVDRVGRRPIILYGFGAVTAVLLIIGGTGTDPSNPAMLKATVAFMSLWGFLYQLSIGAVAYAIAPETPAARVRQKTYSIGLMVTGISNCLVVEVTPILINPSNADLGAKVTFVFFALCLPIWVYFYFCLPETKGRTYLELEEMFQQRVPARKFASYEVHVQVVSEKDDGAQVVHQEESV